MKLKRLLWSAAFITLTLSCQDDEGSSDPFDKLSPYARQFFAMHFSAHNSMKMSADAVVNESFQSTMANFRGMRGGRIAGDSVDGEEPDTLIYTPWQSCAEITVTQNADGSTTTVYDYGDGCEEGWYDYKYFMHGKYTIINYYTVDRIGSMYHCNYKYLIEYENYGGRYAWDSTAWLYDGRSQYEGISTYDTVARYFSGQYNYDDTTSYTIGDEVSTYRSHGNAHYDQDGGVVEECAYSYVTSENEYSSKVLEPLISDYTCNQRGLEEFNLQYVWIYVAGREEISYKQDGLEGTFEIDYGNGACDNIIHITENGIRTRIDMGDIYYTWEKNQGVW